MHHSGDGKGGAFRRVGMPADVMLDPRDLEIARLRAALADAEAALKREVDARRRSDVLNLSDAKLLAQLNEAQRLSKTGSYTSDLAKDEHIWSDELYRIFGLEVGSEKSAQRVFEMIHPEDVPIYQAAFERASHGTASDFTFRIITPQGVVKFLRTLGKIEAKPGGGFETTGGVQDVTESKLAEQALKASEAELRRVLAQLNEAQRLSKTGSSTSDLETDEHVWSEELYRIAEIEPGSTITTQLFFDLVHPDDRAALQAAIQAGMDGNLNTADVMIRFVTSAGLKHIRLVASRMTEFGGRPTFVGAVQDITEATLAKQALAASKRTLTETIDTISTIVIGSNVDGSVEFTNRQWLEYTGLPLERSLGDGWQAAVHPDDIARLMRFWSEMSKDRGSVEYELRLRRHDGQYRWFSVRSTPFRDEAGEVLRWYSTSTDIEDRKRAEAELRRAHNSFADAQRLSHTGSFIADIAADAFTCSDEAYCIFEFELGSKVTLGRIRDAVHPDDRGRFDAAVVRGASGVEGDEFLFRIVTKNGAIKFVQTLAHLVEGFGDRPALVGAIQDVTESKVAEDALRRSEAVLAHGEAASETGSFLWKLDTNEVRWSDQLYRIYEFEPGSLVTVERIAERIHPQDTAFMRDMTSRAHEGLDSNFEHRMVMPNGSIKYLHFVARSIRDPDGRLEYMGSVQDITNRKLAEQEHDRVRSELTHAARALSLGVLTASLAHEVNQPLAGIITNANTCVRMLSADPPNVTGAQRTARRTVRDGKRASDVVKRLRALFARKDFAVESVDLTDATREVLELSANELRRHHVNVSTEFDGAVEVAGDRVQIQQVILNLVLNACDAVKLVEDRPRNIVVRTGGDDTGCGFVAVRDTGVGISSESLGKIFNAFYSTKPDGMGIGLSISRSIVERHSGRIWAEPNEGPGMTFSFSIPVKAPSL